MAKSVERDKRREARWRRIISKHFSSGLNIRDFCRRSKLPESAFYFWRRELERRDMDWREAEHSSGVAVAKPEEQRKRPSAQAAFVPVRLAVSNAERVAQDTSIQAHGRIVIELSGGRRVHVTAPVDRQALADVMAVLSLDLDARDEEGRPSFAKATAGEPC